MATDWIVRLGIAVGLGLLGWGIFRVTRYVSLKRVAGKRAKELNDLQPGIATVVYFTTPDCLPCKTIQRPALARLRDILGEGIRVIEINTYENPEIAKEWGVLSFPSTFIFDQSGIPRQVIYGVTGVEKLMNQVRNI